MGENQRRNNSNDMTVTEQIIKVREEMCDRFCKYRNDKLISQETLDAICEFNCPLRKL